MVDILNVIRHGVPSEVENLQPHPYDNYPSRKTGAVLPFSSSGYTTYDVPTPGIRGRGARRIVRDTGNGISYYTNNHYWSFFEIDTPDMYSKYLEDL